MLIKNSALLIISTIVCIIFLELYLKHQHAEEYKSLLVKYAGKDLCTTRSDNPKLVYTYIPRKCGNNSKGYIDSEYKHQKGEDTFRIVIIGDSVAEGQGVPLGKSFGKVLEKRLNHNIRDAKFEVIVLARTGYTTSQQLILQDDEALGYKPNVIIWSYVLNDPAHPVFHDINRDLGRFYFEPKSHITHLFNKFLFLLKERVATAGCDIEYHKWLHCAHSNKVEQNINRIGDVSRVNNVPVLFIVHPVFETNGHFSKYKLKSLHDELANQSTTAGLTAIDLLDAYKNYSAKELHLEVSGSGWWDPWHPNVLGHELIADYLYSYITDSKLIESKTKYIK